MDSSGHAVDSGIILIDGIKMTGTPYRFFYIIQLKQWLYSMKNPNEQYIKEAEAKYLQRDKIVNQYHSEYKTDWEKIEPLLKNSGNRPKNKEIFRNACIALLNFMRFDKVEETDSSIKMLLWGKFFSQNQNLIQKMFAPFRNIKNSDLPPLPVRIRFKSEPERYENLFAEMAGGARYSFDIPEEVVDFFLNDPIFNNYYSEFSADEYTPPVTPTELSDKLEIHPSIISNPQKPLGKFFHECCEDQNTNTPRLHYVTLFPLARKCIQQSKQLSQTDKEAFNDIDDLMILWISRPH